MLILLVDMELGTAKARAHDAPYMVHGSTQNIELGRGGGKV